VIETYARLRFGKELERSVVEAVFKRLIPESVFQQIADHILKANIIRKDCHLILEVVPEKTTGGEYQFLYTSKLAYKIYNRTGYNPIQAITSSLDHDVKANDSAGKPLPRFESVKINEMPYNESMLQKHIREYTFTREERLPAAAFGG